LPKQININAVNESPQCCARATCAYDRS